MSPDIQGILDHCQIDRRVDRHGYRIVRIQLPTSMLWAVYSLANEATVLGGNAHLVECYFEHHHLFMSWQQWCLPTMDVQS
ncbi:MAG: hypothetical protein AAFQ57_02030 [Cyanobacteria bacterium J06626_14]